MGRKNNVASIDTVIAEIRSLKSNLSRIDRNTTRFLLMHADQGKELASVKTQVENNVASIKATNSLLWKFMLASTTISSVFGVVAAILAKAMP